MKKIMVFSFLIYITIFILGNYIQYLSLKIIYSFINLTRRYSICTFKV
jgi:hypothetical protein